MTDYKQHYKAKPFGFGNAKEGRLLRMERHAEERKKQRAKTFNENRNAGDFATSSAINKEKDGAPVEDLRARLVKWKVERNKRKLIEKIKKKPPFKVGVVHHKIYSPICKDAVVVPVTKNTMTSNQTHRTSRADPPNPPKRVTRATEKRLMIKAAAKKPVLSNSTKDTNSITNKEKHLKKNESFAPIGYEFKAPNNLPQMPLFGRVPIVSLSPCDVSRITMSSPKVPNRKSTIPKFETENINTKENIPEIFDHVDQNIDNHTDQSSIETLSLKLSSDEKEVSSPENDNNTEVQKNSSIVACSEVSSEPVFFSPYVVASRGKSSARKEQQVRRGLSLGRSPDDDTPTKENVMKNFNISVEEEERTAQYFLFILQKEIDRLTELCNKWTEVKSESDITEDAQYQINQAIGQTKLLMNKKFERFRGLVSECESGKGEMLVTCKDLQGFWDMMYMEVKNCDSRFDKLEKLRSRNWEEEQSIIVPVTKKSGVLRKKVVPTKASSIRTFLAERKKKMMIQKTEGIESKEEFGVISKNGVSSKFEKSENSPSVKHKHRRSKSFGLNEVESTPFKHDGARLSLLQKVQLSETTKKTRSPLTIMKISKMCKTPEVKLDDTISYVNSNQTPGKSILKRLKDVNELESRTKSAHKVNFDDDVVLSQIPYDEETPTKVSLAAALKRIDSFNFDNCEDEMQINAERKLTYDDDSFDEHKSPESVHEETFSEINTTISKDTINIPVVKVVCATPLQESWDHNIDTVLPKKSLRGRSSVHKRTPKPKKSVSIKKEHDTPDQMTSEDTELNVSKQALHKHDSVHIELELDKNDDNTKVLRNRIVVSESAFKAKRNSRNVSLNVQDSEYKENETVSRITRNNSLKVTTHPEAENCKTDLEEDLNKISLNSDNNKVRRSTRRSVKFAAKDCSGCVESKTVLPVTPHVRRSKTRLSEKKRISSASTGDLISWETPEKPPERVRRSQYKKE